MSAVPHQDHTPGAPGPDAIWGAKPIAKYLGCTVSMVYGWADDDDVPIGRKGGHYFARRSELTAWLKRKS